jgi:hypothetical protein
LVLFLELLVNIYYEIFVLYAANPLCLWGYILENPPNSETMMCIVRGEEKAQIND